MSQSDSYTTFEPKRPRSHAGALKGAEAAPWLVRHMDRIPFAAGELSSNVYLVTWENALLNGKVVSPASFKAMTTSNGFVTDGTSYGFGLVLGTYNGHQFMGHNGEIGGFNSEEVVFLDSGLTLVVLTNDDNVGANMFVVSILNAVCSSAPLSSACGHAN